MSEDREFFFCFNNERTLNTQKHQIIGKVVDDLSVLDKISQKYNIKTDPKTGLETEEEIGRKYIYDCGLYK